MTKIVHTLVLSLMRVSSQKVPSRRARRADRLRTTVKIVRKPVEQRGFAVQPRRWVVKWTLAWLTAHRRLARDYERDPAVSEALIRWAAINGMLRRITRGHPSRRQLRRTLSTPD